MEKTQLMRVYKRTHCYETTYVVEIQGEIVISRPTSTLVVSDIAVEIKEYVDRKKDTRFSILSEPSSPIEIWQGKNPAFCEALSQHEERELFSYLHRK